MHTRQNTARVWERVRRKVDARVGRAIAAAAEALSRRIYQAAGGENRPVSFDVQTTAPALLGVQKSFLVIRQEVEALLQSGVTIPRYHELDPYQKSISEGPKKWKVFVLDLLGARPNTATELCPNTLAVLDRVPDLFQALFSILEAGKSVPAHRGPFVGMIRYHLGLIVPKVNPPSIRVKDVIYTWKEGDGFLFDDTWDHEVFNSAESDRVVLMVDILRPLPWRLRLLNRMYKAFLGVAFSSGMIANAERFR